MEKLLPIAALAKIVSTAGTVHGNDEDVIPTSSGDLKITFIGHGTLLLSCGGKVVHVDPWSEFPDYGNCRKRI